jgi:rfaE bifunctional protein kinase chain/domain
MQDLDKLFGAFSSLKIGVIGDVMLDTYMWGAVERISPEAPVPVVSLNRKDYRIGGAGNVALNCSSLGAEVYIISVTGKDEDAKKLKDLFRENNIHTTYLLESAERITTNKTRVISRNQQMMRLDAEMTTDLNESDEHHLWEQLTRFVKNEKPDIIIFEDYNKGVLTEKIIQQTIACAKNENILTAVDPKRKHFFSYTGTDIFKPNLKEVKEGLNMLFDHVDIHVLRKIHSELQSILHHTVSFITLSEKGVFYQQAEQAAIIPSHLRHIADVSGAGDTVIAVASMVYAVTSNAHLMAEIANIAGGLVCEEVGTVAINKDRLLDECELLLS